MRVLRPVGMPRGVILLSLCILLCACSTDQEQFLSFSSEELPSETGESSVIPEQEPSLIYVYVCGMVASPGVYALPADSRVYMALEAAGGCLPEGDPESINQARVLCDGDQIRIPQRGSPESAAAAAGEPVSDLVDLNTADMAALCTLTGIGESKAAAIIAWRQEHGPFSKTEDLKKVDGIGEKTFERIRDDITVN